MTTTAITVVYTLDEIKTPQFESLLRKVKLSDTVSNVIVCETSPIPRARNICERVGVTYLHTHGYNVYYVGGILECLNHCKTESFVYFSWYRASIQKLSWANELSSKISGDTVWAGSIQHSYMDRTCSHADISKNGLKNEHVQGALFAGSTSFAKSNYPTCTHPHIYSDVWISGQVQRAGLNQVDVPSIKSVAKGVCEYNPSVSAFADYRNIDNLGP